MWVAGGILNEFYSQFLSCFSKLSSTPEDTLAKYEGLSFTCMYVICKELKFALKAAYLGRIGIVISQHIFDIRITSKISMI